MSDGDSPGFWRRLLGKGGGSGAAPAASPSSATPSALARYRLERELGRGSMGAVHLAEDTQTGQRVAVKLLALQREFSADDLADVRQRFMREARAAGHLQHPDILQILDAGEAGEDAWIVMEYVDGQDLSHFTRSSTLLPAAEVLGLVIRLARALDYAHRQGVVHRDIKPANVMLDRPAGKLKVMDFGIARIADGSRTRTGLVLGTPSFMSPEQLAGLKVDGRSDLYSLGVMLFQMLTGKLPHQSESMARLMQKIATQPPPDVRHFRSDLPESLAMVLALALEKRPELRYANGEAMAQDLEAVLAQGLQEAPDLPLGDDPPAAADPFAQTLRLDGAEAGQNAATPAPPDSSEPPP
ncbi:serine/threonine-protein kinase [Pelomonas sp. KK5]|uniref:serine/threonine-protein kinase n=1 Tax=Pelomonas sp. KK5 TaxID=1855730 RepID=UPI00097C7AC1|nr:serine/threonine-protein kinase [Pelomonas sp. KK5]